MSAHAKAEDLRAGLWGHLLAMPRRQVLLLAGGAAASLLLAFLLLAAWLVPRVLDSPIMYQLFHGGQVERRFGFRHDTPYRGEPGCMVEVIELQSITRGGAFEAAGFRPHEVVEDVVGVENVSLSEFFVQLGELEPGQSLDVIVRVPVDGACVSDWPERTVRVVAP